LHRALANEELLRQLQLEDSTTKGIKDLKVNLAEASLREKEAAKREKEALEKEKSFKLAFKMAKLGDSVEEIMEETNLSREEIEEIKKKLA